MGQEEATAENTTTVEAKTTPAPVQLTDSTVQLQNQATYGSFADLVQPRAEKRVVFENQSLSFEFTNKGGQMTKAHLKGYTNYLGEPLNLIDNNQRINFRFTTLDGRTLNTEDLYFSINETQEQGKKVLWLKAALNSSQYIAYRYALDENDFMLDFSIQTQGLQTQRVQRLWKVRIQRISSPTNYTSYLI